MIDILISQVDEHNESNILATKELNPEIIYFIKDKSCNNKADTLKKYYERNFKNIKLNFFDIKEGDNTALEKLIKNSFRFSDVSAKHFKPRVGAIFHVANHMTLATASSNVLANYFCHIRC